MKLLTVTQPWASLIAIGAKRIETRSWSTSYRGAIAIHAAKTLNGIYKGATEDDLRVLCDGPSFAQALWPERPSHADRHPADDLPRGCIVAVCDLIDVQMIGYEGGLLAGYNVPRTEIPFGNYTPGRYAWLFDNVRALPVPYEIRGERGITELDARVARYISKETEALA